MKNQIAILLFSFGLAGCSPVSEDTPEEILLADLSHLCFLSEERSEYYAYAKNENGERIIEPDGTSRVEKRLLDNPALLVDRFEVTNQEFSTFLRGTTYKPEGPGFLFNWVRVGEQLQFPAGLDHHPVVFVSAVDAEAFARWKGMRLPTQQEWERMACGIPDPLIKIARALSWTKYPWGDNWSSQSANTLEFGFYKTSPVGAFENGKAKYTGIYDASGNVWEWVSRKAGSNEYIGKGGAFDNRKELALCEQEFPLDVHQRIQDVGFRCVVECQKYLERRLIGKKFNASQKRRLKKIALAWGSEFDLVLEHLEGNLNLDRELIRELRNALKEK